MPSASDQELIPLGASPEGRTRSWKRKPATLEQALPPLRKRSVGELIDVAFDIFRAHFWICLGAGVVIWLPLRLAQPFFGLHRAEASESPLYLAGALALTGLAPHAAQTIIAALVALLVYASIQGYEIRARTVMRYTLKRTFALALLTILSTTAVWVGTVACCVPGILLMWKFYLAPAVLVLEGVGLGDAVKRSFYLTRESFWRWLGVTLVLFCLVIPLSSVSGVADDANARAELLDFLPVSERGLDAVMVVFSTLFLAITSALTSIVITVFYLDCRVRHEGHDLRMRLERLRKEHEDTGATLDRPPAWES